MPVGRWNNTHNRVWLGEEFWANPMEDWRIVDGAAECQTAGGDRNIHLVTHQITNVEGSFTMAVHASQLEVRRQDGGVGFRIGIRSDLNEYRSNCFAKGGVDAGLANDQLVLGRKTQELDRPANLQDKSEPAKFPLPIRLGEPLRRSIDEQLWCQYQNV